MQADCKFRRDQQDLTGLKARGAIGETVPIGTVARLKEATIPYRVPRYNLSPAAGVRGVSTGTVLQRSEELVAKVQPLGMGFEWMEVAFQQEQKGTPTALVFGVAAPFVLLVLATNYESWKIPLAVVLIVQMRARLRQRPAAPRYILAQIGFVVLVGLAAKNAILIVKLARQDAGSPAARRNDHSTGRDAVAARPGDRRRGAVIDAGA